MSYPIGSKLPCKNGLVCTGWTVYLPSKLY